MDIERMAQDAWMRLRRKEWERALRFGPKPERERDKRRKLPKMAVP